MLYKGYPQPWRTWLLILTALIVALFIVQIVTSTGWVLIVVLFALIAIQFAVARHARRQSLSGSGLHLSPHPWHVPRTAVLWWHGCFTQSKLE